MERLSSILILSSNSSAKVAAKQARMLYIPKGCRPLKIILIKTAEKKNARVPSRVLFLYILTRPKALPTSAAALSDTSITVNPIMAAFLLKKHEQISAAVNTYIEPEG